MTYMDLIGEIRELNFPCAYRHFASPPSLPYCVVTRTHNVDLVADNQNYLDVENYQLELYHNIKHPPSEMLIQNKLKELRLPYFKMEAFLSDDKLYQTIYEIQLIGG